MARKAVGGGWQTVRSSYCQLQNDIQCNRLDVVVEALSTVNSSRDAVPGGLLAVHRAWLSPERAWGGGGAQE